MADRHSKSALALMFLIAFFLSLGLLVYGGALARFSLRLAGALPLRQLLRDVACRCMVPAGREVGFPARARPAGPCPALDESENAARIIVP